MDRKTQKPKIFREFVEIEFEEELFSLPGVRKVNNLYLAYTIFRILKEFDSRFMSKTRFYKILFLVYQRLRKRGINIQLPYFWYRWGNVICEPSLPITIEYVHHGDRQIPQIMQKPENGLEEDKKKKIDEIVKLAKQDLERKTVDELIDEVYKFAPTKFQKEFREFKKYLDQGNIVNASLKISDLFGSFPKDEFEKLISFC